MIILALVAAAAPEAPRDPRPLHPLAAWVSDADYPAGAIRRGASGTVAFTLDIDAAGVPTRCTVTGRADRELDQRTCDIFMERARFEPAHDGRGRAVAGSVSDRIRWVLPATDETMPFAAIRVTTAVVRDVAGNIGCSIRINGGDSILRAGEECGFLSGSGAADALRRFGTPGALVADYVLTPEGATPVASAGQPDGELIYEDSAHLVVTPDGTVAGCRGAGPRTIRVLPGVLSLPSPCPAQAARFKAAPGTAPRGAEVAIRIYLRGIP